MRWACKTGSRNKVVNGDSPIARGVAYNCVGTMNSCAVRTNYNNGRGVRMLAYYELVSWQFGKSEREHGVIVIAKKQKESPRRLTESFFNHLAKLDQASWRR